jgi:hypothetical protein
MIGMISGSCEAAREETDSGEDEPGGGAENENRLPDRTTLRNLTVEEILTIQIHF